MANNGFRLEKVLNYRKEVEKMRTVEFTAAKREFEGACKRLKDEEQRVGDLNSECLERQRDGITAMELQVYADFFQRKSTDIRGQRLEADNLESRMAEKQGTLVEAAREKKVLESLKEKKAMVHKRDLLEKERSFLEEIALRKKLHGN